MVNLERTGVILFYYFVYLKVNLDLEKNNQIGESWPNSIFMEVNLDPIGIEKRWTDDESWPNSFVEKVNRGEDLRWVSSRCPLTCALQGNCTLNQNWASFMHYLKIIITVFKKCQRFLSFWSKQYFARFDQYNSRTAWPSEILRPFLSFSANLLQDTCIILTKSAGHFEILRCIKHAQFKLRCSSSMSFFSDLTSW